MPIFSDDAARRIGKVVKLIERDYFSDRRPKRRHNTYESASTGQGSGCATTASAGTAISTTAATVKHDTTVKKTGSIAHDTANYTITPGAIGWHIFTWSGQEEFNTATTFDVWLEEDSAVVPGTRRGWIISGAGSSYSMAFAHYVTSATKVYRVRASTPSGTGQLAGGDDFRASFGCLKI